MNKRKLGPKGPEVTPLGFGCMRFPTIDGKIDRNTSTAMLMRAIDAGVNYLDTAWPYHNEESEPFVAEVLGSLDASRREEIVIADKMPTWLVKSTGDLDRYFDEQRKRLNCETIDVYHLHALNTERWETMQKVGALDWLAGKKESGEIRYAGFSFHDSYPVFESIIENGDWDVCQIQYNFMDVEEQAGLKGLRLAHEKGIGVIVMEPLLGGKLIKAPSAIADIWAKSSQKEWSPVERALRWLWDQKEVGIVLSGMSAMSHVDENLRIASEAEIGVLSETEKSLYDEARVVYQSLKAIGCTSCEYCLPCPQGVDIPRNFRAYNQAAMFSNLDNARSEYAWMLTSFEKGLSKSDPRGINCISCGECETKCPQKLEIARLMPEVAAVLGGEKEMS